MEEIFFNELLNDKLTGVRWSKSEIVENALKQLSRCRFEFKADVCSVVIRYKNKLVKILFTNDISLYKFSDLLHCYSNEPSTYFMRNKINSYDKSLFTYLKEYKDRYYLLGGEYKNAKWYKFYNTVPLNDPMRILYNSKWIDYEKQLEEGNIIYDENNLCGLWAMPYEMVLSCFNEEFKNRYGSKLMVVKPVSDCRYINDGKEIIGDRYLVTDKYDLTNINDMGKFIQFYCSIKEEFYCEKIKGLETEISEQIEENEKLNTQLYNLENMNNKKLKFLLTVSCVLFGFLLRGLL